MEERGSGVDDLRAQLEGGGARRVPHHERHAAGVRAEVDRAHIRVDALDVHARQFDVEHLGDDRGEERVRPLADVGLHRVHGDAAVHVRFQVDRRLRHLGGEVDRAVRAGDVEPAAEPDAAAVRELAELLLPTARALRSVQALQERRRRDAELVDGRRVRRQGVAAPQVERVDAQLLGELVEGDLHRVADVRAAVRAHRTARRLGRVHPASLVAEVRDPVRPHRQHAVVVRRDGAERAPRAAVDERFDVVGEETPLGVRRDAHVVARRVAAVVRVEDVLPVEEHLHRTAGLERQRGAGDLVRQRVRLPAEPPADLWLDDPDPVHRQAEDLGERPVEVMGDLGRAPDGEAAVRGRFRERDERLGERMGDAGERPAHADLVGRRGERGVDVAEMLDDLLLDVRAREAAGVDRLGDRSDPALRVRVLGEWLDLEADLLERELGRPLVRRRHGRDDVADVAGLADRDRGLVVGDRQDAERGRVLFAGQDRRDPRHRAGFAEIDGDDPGVRPRAAEQPPDQLARATDVVRVLGPARHLERALDVRDAFPEKVERLGGGCGRRTRGHQGCSCAARSTARTMER